eukprot:COSAG03_NODE_83_length_13818_cov_11.329543_7_plen_543_part_00
MRFALGGISCECNGFAAGETGTEYFRQTGFLLAGEEMLSLRNTSAEIGGAIDLLTKAAEKGSAAGKLQATVEIVPLLGARANSAAPLSNACWNELRSGLLSRLGAAVQTAPVDAVLLAMHGNMCVGNAPGEPVNLDPEGTLARDVRRIVGADSCVVMTVDLHANITPLMIEQLDACISYDHYPHDDIFRTGQRAAWLMLRAARGEVKPVLVASKINMMQTAMKATTIIRPDGSHGVGGALMLSAKRAEQEEGWSQPFLDPWENEWFTGSRHYGRHVHPASDSGNPADDQSRAVLTASMNFIHPHNDFPDMGNTAVVCVDAMHPIVFDGADRTGSHAAAVSLGTVVSDRLVMQFWERREEFAVEAYTVEEAVRRGRATQGLILLLELADCAGGGASSDSSALVRELLACGAGQSESEMCLSMCVDPVSAAACVAAGEGATVALDLGHGLDPKWGDGPLPVSGKVTRVTTVGKFKYDGGPFGGTEAAMGECGIGCQASNDRPTLDDCVVTAVYLCCACSRSLRSVGGGGSGRQHPRAGDVQRHI